MQVIYGDSFGGVRSLELPFDSRDDSAKRDAASAYRRSLGRTADIPVPTLMPVLGDPRQEDLAIAA